MPVKNEESLARLLGASFSEYANRVQNGLTAPYRGLLSVDSVEVVLVVSSDGGVSVKEPVIEPLILDVPVVPPVLEATVETVEVVEEKPKRKRKTE